MDWDTYFLQMAEAASAKSKDPSTKVGAVIVRPDQTIASTGWNGFPRGVNDSPVRYDDRQTKYRFVCHAEANAVVAARCDLTDHTIYVTLPPCHECAKLIIQAGIRRVVAPRSDVSRWQESFDTANMMFWEAGVRVNLITSQRCRVDEVSEAA